MKPGWDGEILVFFHGFILEAPRHDETGGGDPVCNFTVSHHWTNSKGQRTQEKIPVSAYGQCAIVMALAEPGKRIRGRGMWRRGQVIADVVEWF